MKDTDPAKLSLNGCQYSGRINKSIADKSDSALPMTLLYNNFMGTDRSTGKGDGVWGTVAIAYDMEASADKLSSPRFSNSRAVRFHAAALG